MVHASARAHDRVRRALDARRHGAHACGQQAADTAGHGKRADGRLVLRVREHGNALRVVDADHGDHKQQRKFKQRLYRARVADALGMSQSTVSTLLARLRHIAGDPRFIRSAQGMQPTALAREWAEPVAAALMAFEPALNAPARFEAAASRRTVVIYMTDVGQSLVLNKLAARVEATAPGVRLRIVSSWEGALGRPA